MLVDTFDGTDTCGSTATHEGSSVRIENGDTQRGLQCRIQIQDELGEGQGGGICRGGWHGVERPMTGADSRLDDPSTIRSGEVTTRILEEGCRRGGR